MRSRDRVLASLERVYREAFLAADQRDDSGVKERLDLEFQRDQLLLEALLDIRDLLAAAPEPTTSAPESGGAQGLLEKAEALRRITRLR